MTRIYETALAHVGLPRGLPRAEWDLTSFLENAKSQIQVWGGGLLLVLGAAALVWGGVQLVKKLMANPQTAGQQQGWGTIALLILVGGALSTGGWELVSTVGSGGQKTIEDLGGSTIIVQMLGNIASSGVFG